MTHSQILLTVGCSSILIVVHSMVASRIWTIALILKYSKETSVSISSCDSGYKGPQCDESQDFNILYVVPSGQKLHYVLIAAIIGAVQIAIIVAVVMCITRWVVYLFFLRDERVKQPKY